MFRDPICPTPPPWRDAIYRNQAVVSRWKEKASERVDTCREPCHVVNVFQNADYFGSTALVAPRLMTKSWLVDAVTDREVVAAQHFLIQGFPFPGLVDPVLSKFFPFPSIVELECGSSDDRRILTNKDIRILTGLSFHWASLAAMLMFAWSVSEI